MESNFKDRLIYALKERNMKAVELAERSGLNKSSISQYKNGVYEAKNDALFKLAKALNVSESWLAGHDVSMERLGESNTFLFDYKSDKLKSRIPNLDQIAGSYENESEVLHLSTSIENKLATPISNKEYDISIRVEDDSMSLFRILKGDIVFIRKVSKLEDNKVYAMLIDEKLTLRRAKQIKKSVFLLISECTTHFKTIHYDETMNNIKFPIIGKVVAFESKNIE